MKCGAANRSGGTASIVSPRSRVERAGPGRRRARTRAHRRAAGTRRPAGAGLAQDVLAATRRRRAPCGAGRCSSSTAARGSGERRSTGNVGRLAERGKEADDAARLGHHGDELHPPLAGWALEDLDPTSVNSRYRRRLLPISVLPSLHLLRRRSPRPSSRWLACWS
jgi:hypothetical protein